MCIKSRNPIPLKACACISRGRPGCGHPWSCKGSDILGDWKAQHQSLSLSVLKKRLPLLPPRAAFPQALPRSQLCEEEMHEVAAAGQWAESTSFVIDGVQVSDLPTEGRGLFRAADLTRIRATTLVPPTFLPSLLLTDLILPVDRNEDSTQKWEC